MDYFWSQRERELDSVRKMRALACCRHSERERREFCVSSFANCAAAKEEKKYLTSLWVGRVLFTFPLSLSLSPKLHANSLSLCLSFLALALCSRAFEKAPEQYTPLCYRSLHAVCLLSLSSSLSLFVQCAHPSIVGGNEETKPSRKKKILP